MKVMVDMETLCDLYKTLNELRRELRERAKAHGTAEERLTLAEARAERAERIASLRLGATLAAHQQTLTANRALAEIQAVVNRTFTEK